MSPTCDRVEIGDVKRCARWKSATIKLKGMFLSHFMIVLVVFLALDFSSLLNEISRYQLKDTDRTRVDQGVREVIPHIGPIPIIIPLNFPRIMLPRALRGSW